MKAPDRKQSLQRAPEAAAPARPAARQEPLLQTAPRCVAAAPVKTTTAIPLPPVRAPDRHHLPQ